MRKIAVAGGSLPIHLHEADSDAPMLVFLHYWGGSHRTFTPLLEQLEYPGTVVTYDHRGWGESRGLPGPYDITQLAADAHAVLTELAPERFVLIGHSMGGKVAQLLAARRLPGLAGVVLIGPAPARPAVTPEAQRQLVHAYDSAETVAGALEHVLTHRRLSDALREQVIQDSLAGSTATHEAWALDSIARDISAVTPRIEVPVVVLAGEHDLVEPPQLLADHLLPHVPTATMRVVPDTGHLSPLENPGALAEAVRVALAELTPISPLPR
ncbi:alpha/beta fold hydrolase [Nocardia sp. CDC160]|uniref:alpha/beta fold hydrolase n=1 Tax=Nocardia sp. CDC160 TaxID=3112166 RepID=UPI002DBFE557|nr:alpha/beta hydrolase [Nocardia sp. CDC160]MEC3916187.1 alpha/beta hydrolase [Nocardia sp. CDC160]